MDNFVGHLTTFKGDNEVVNGELMIEVTEAWRTGVVEIAFDDRGERCYVKFDLAEVVRRVLLMTASE
jgi:hypothetical protein